MRQVLLLLFPVLWAAIVAAQGGVVDPRHNYRIPAGFVYQEASLTPEKARELAKRHAVLTLLKVTALSPEVAENLVTPYRDTFLTLPALETIDADAAAKLSVRRGYLRLWGITSLTPEVAAALVGSPGQVVDVTGVREITPEVAHALVRGKRDKLGLGLTTLSTAIAEILAEFPYDLDFPYLETLSLESAKAIAEHGEVVQLGSETVGPTLDLGKARLTPAIAEALLAHDGPLGFRLKRLEHGVGDILAKHRFPVLLMLEEIDSVPLARKLFSEPYASTSVVNLRTMSPEIAAEYAMRNRSGLHSLDTLTVDAARELAKCKRTIKLPAITAISPELATALTERTRAVYLSGLKSLDGPDAVAVAEALASTPAPVYIDYLERVSAPALAALRKKATIKIPPDEKLTIVP